MSAVVCELEGCTEPLPPKRGGGRPPRYCSPYHRQKAFRARKSRERNRAQAVKGVNRPLTTKAESLDGRGSARRGEGYEQFCASGLPDRIAAGEMTSQQACDEYATSSANVSRWMAAWVEDRRLEAARAGWKPADDDLALLAPEQLPQFRARFFRVPDEGAHVLHGRPYETPDFQREWCDVIEQAVRAGVRKAILAPPRHGKTELLVHKCIQVIIRNPNVRIMWVGGNEEIASDAVDMVADELNSNEALRAAYCAPGTGFKPTTRTGKQWSRGRFTVATRSMSLKSPTLVAVGKGGKLLSRDADLIIVDDIVDEGSTRQPKSRADDLRWFSTQLSSRKEPHTGIVVIGSRQHPEDLYASLIQMPTFDVRVYQAHSLECTVPADDVEAHRDCLLFAQLRPFSWLMEARQSMGDALYEMVYLNRPRSEGMTIFARETVEQCRDRSRNLGDVPPDTRLIAGVDPGGGSGYQAAVLWAVHVDSNTRFLVDIENHRGGGVVHLRSLLAKWSQQYPNLREWVIEENILNDTLTADLPLRELRDRLGLRFIPHMTGRNKWDLRMGVTAMAPHFENGLINLPYCSPATKAAVDVYINQLANFSDRRTSHDTWWPTDIVMAGWVPERTIQSWQMSHVTEIAKEYRRTDYPWQTRTWGRR